MTGRVCYRRCIDELAELLADVANLVARAAASWASPELVMCSHMHSIFRSRGITRQLLRPGYQEELPEAYPDKQTKRTRRIPCEADITR